MTPIRDNGTASFEFLISGVDSRFRGNDQVSQMTLMPEIGAAIFHFRFSSFDFLVSNFCFLLFSASLILWI
jgi:hypothetical protein